ncbi:MAG: hypothetical protein E7526_02860 [Ruminococcaceae bacterium]|nr:hypothetical protein [Oscillospiraceae bacterium]
MKIKINSKKISIIFIVVLLLVVYVFAVCNVNAKYKPALQETYEFGEMFQIESVQMKMTKAVFMREDEMPDDEAFNKSIKHLLDYRETKIPYLILMEMDIINTSEKNVRVDLTNLHLESGAFSLQPYYELMVYYNQCGMYVDLEPGENKTLKLPVPILKIYFPESDWRSIENREFSLVFSLYPKKQIAKISFS